MPRLICTKPMTYGTRRLQAGDEFEARPQDVRLLLGIRKARVVPPEQPQVEQPPEPPQVPQEGLQAQEPADDGLDALRAEAKALGIEVDRRWRAKRLREEIERASRGAA